MVLSFDQKKHVVAELNDMATSAVSIVSAHNMGVTANDMTRLRALARDEGVVLRVVKNNLLKLALDGTPFACMDEIVSGPTLLAFSNEDPGAAARLLVEFTKTNDKLVFTGVSLGGSLLGPEAVKDVAKLPTLEQALGTLAGTLMAPVTQVAQLSNELVARLPRVCQAVADAKQA